jgi:hypothetical protein
MKIVRSLALSLAAIVGVAHHAFAADVRVIHGINGRDLGLARELPVDISVNGTCALKGVTFRQSTKVELGAGEYTVRVFVATGSCAGSPVIEKQVTIAPAAEKEAFSLVASLSSNGTPQLAVFQNTGTTILTPGIGIRHVAKAGPVRVRVGIREPWGRLPSLVQTIRNGEEASSLILGGTTFRYSGSLEPRSAKRVTLPARDVRKAYRILYVVGSAENGFSIITETIKLPRK